MKIIHTVEEWNSTVKPLTNGKTLGFVPTMGALHEGHLSLVNRAGKENDLVAVSIYLNPTQFNDKNDLTTYPSNFSQDCSLLEKANVDFLFAPTYDVMYPDNYTYKLTETDFSKTLCGAARPGHFDGVLTVVMKLFNIVRPQNAYFGEKDFQQMKLLEGMVKAFFLDVKIIPCPIVRQDDGLALSSRNKKLSPNGIKIAPLFHKILSEKNTSEEDKKQKLEEAGFTVDYITTVNGRLYGAVFLENVRLIDNIEGTSKNFSF